MKLFVRSRAAAWCLVLVLCTPSAHAGLFDDAEARRAIIDLREKVTKLIEQQRASELESAATQEQLAQLKRSLFDLNGQLELSLVEAARLRGLNEQLAQDVAELQRVQRDIRQGLDDRIRKLEPQPVRFEGKDFLADVDEQRQFEDALALVKKGEFSRSATSFMAFQQRYPTSGYSESVLYWLGNAQYAKREYREAILSFKSLVAQSPTHSRAPQALLSVASCQTELKDHKSARRTLEDLLRLYPASEAAIAAKERLSLLKQ